MQGVRRSGAGQSAGGAGELCQSESRGGGRAADPGAKPRAAQARAAGPERSRRGADRLRRRGGAAERQPGADGAGAGRVEPGAGGSQQHRDPLAGGRHGDLAQRRRRPDRGRVAAGANDLSKMEVHTSVDEADVGNVRQEQPVTFTVDAFPARRFRGKVHQVRNAPTIVQNVVTYDAVVRIDNKDLLLKPGMTANVQFLVSEKEDALTIPNMALRFKPAEEKNESEELLRQEQTRTAPRVGARRTSRPGSGGGSAGRRVRQVKVYVLRGNKAQSIDIEVGITDGTKSEVLSGPLKENDPVIIGMSSGAAQNQAPANPFQPARVGIR